MAYDNYKRQICVHYTILDSLLNHVAGGIARAQGIPKEITDLILIKENYFPEICNQIINSIPNH